MGGNWGQVIGSGAKVLVSGRRGGQTLVVQSRAEHITART